jgi:hypothetical protein
MRSLLSHEPDLLGPEPTFKRMKLVLGTPSRLPFEEGKWKPGFGDDLRDEEWEALRRDLFPAANPSG